LLLTHCLSRFYKSLIIISKNNLQHCCDSFTMSRLNESGTVVDKYTILVNESIVKVYKTQKKGDSNPSEQI
jgi:hypothetical protein